MFCVLKIAWRSPWDMITHTADTAMIMITTTTTATLTNTAVAPTATMSLIHTITAPLFRRRCVIGQSASASPSKVLDFHFY